MYNRERTAQQELLTPGRHHLKQSLLYPEITTAAQVRLLNWRICSLRELREDPVDTKLDGSRTQALSSLSPCQGQATRLHIDVKRSAHDGGSRVRWAAGKWVHQKPVRVLLNLSPFPDVRMRQL